MVSFFSLVRVHHPLSTPYFRTKRPLPFSNRLGERKWVKFEGRTSFCSRAVFDARGSRMFLLGKTRARKYAYNTSVPSEGVREPSPPAFAQVSNLFGRDSCAMPISCMGAVSRAYAMPFFSWASGRGFCACAILSTALHMKSRGERSGLGGRRGDGSPESFLT